MKTGPGDCVNWILLAGEICQQANTEGPGDMNA